MVMRPWEEWITETEVFQLHAEGIRRHKGGDDKLLKEGCVEQSLGGAYSAAVYSCEKESDYLLTFCGYLLFYLGSNQCFVNGNKRVPWLSCLHVLLNAGLTLDVADNDAIEYCRRLADHKIPDGSHTVNGLRIT
jgi:prophage maintenance system killer protein